MNEYNVQIGICIAAFTVNIFFRYMLQYCGDLQKDLADFLYLQLLPERVKNVLVHTFFIRLGKFELFITFSRATRIVWPFYRLMFFLSPVTNRIVQYTQYMYMHKLSSLILSCFGTFCLVFNSIRSANLA